MANRIASKTVNESDVVFKFVNGENVTCPVADLPEDMLHRLALHGIAQKVGDSYASAESVEEAISNATAVWSNLTAGVWATKASRGGKYVEALHRVTGKDRGDCLEAWNGMDDGQKKDLRKHPQIKKAIAEIEAENAERLAEQAGDLGDDLSALF